MGLEEQAIENMENSHQRSDGFQGSGNSPKMEEKFKLLLKDLNGWK